MRCQRSALQPVLQILQHKGMCRALSAGEADTAPGGAAKAASTALNAVVSAPTHKRCGNCQCGPMSRSGSDAGTDLQLDPRHFISMG